MSKQIRPSRDRLTWLALEILEDALAQAEYGSVQRNLGHRLALAWLAHIGVSNATACGFFWRAMVYDHGNEFQKKYCRTTYMTDSLNKLYRNLGWQCPSMVERGKRAHACRPSEACDSDSDRAI